MTGDAEEAQARQDRIRALGGEIAGHDQRQVVPPRARRPRPRWLSVVRYLILFTWTAQLVYTAAVLRDGRLFVISLAGWLFTVLLAARYQ